MQEMKEKLEQMAEETADKFTDTFDLIEINDSETFTD
jgi:hypothetical protein